MMRKPVLAVLIAALMAVPAVAFTQTTATKSMATPAATTTTKTSSAMIGTMINVNTASAAELMKIPGVSTTVAAEIIKNRPFRNAAELVERLCCLNCNAGKLRPTNRSSAYRGHLLDHQRKLEV